MSDEPLRVSTFACWCEPCQRWYSGVPWLLGFEDPDSEGYGPFPPMRDPTPAEVDEYAYHCPECGTRLEPRVRPWYRSEDGHR